MKLTADNIRQIYFTNSARLTVREDCTNMMCGCNRARAAAGMMVDTKNVCGWCTPGARAAVVSAKGGFRQPLAKVTALHELGHIVYKHHRTVREDDGNLFHAEVQAWYFAWTVGEGETWNAAELEFMRDCLDSYAEYDEYCTHDFDKALELLDHMGLRYNGKGA